MYSTNRNDKPEPNRRPNLIDKIKGLRKGRAPTKAEANQSGDSISVPYNAQLKDNGTLSEFVERAFQTQRGQLGHGKVEVLKRGTAVIPKDQLTASILEQNTHSRQASNDGVTPYSKIIRNQGPDFKEQRGPKKSR
jgi:hypothetical protein